MDYLKTPLKTRLAKRKEVGNASFCKYSPAYGGIWTNEGDKPKGREPRHMFGWEVREVGPADKIVNLRHAGWYVDNFHSEKTRGLVFRLPGSRGFLAGFSHPWGGEPTVEPSIYPDERGAAFAADRLAEKYGEECREFEAKDLAETQSSEALERIAEIRGEVRELCAELRQTKLPPAICSAVRSSMKGLLRERAKLWKDIRKWKRDFWSAAPQF